MNNKAESRKYRKLSIVTLVTGILGYSAIAIGIFINPYNIFPNIEMGRLISIVIGVALAICLPIVAIVCGSIDLKRIKEGLYSNKGKGFDIAGIVLGSLLFSVALFDFIASFFGG